MHAFRSFILLAATTFSAFTIAAPAGPAPPSTVNNGNSDIQNAHNLVGAPVTAPNAAQGGRVDALNNNHVLSRENIYNNGNGYVENDRNFIGLRRNSRNPSIRDIVNNGNGYEESDDNLIGFKRNVYSPNNFQGGEFNMLNGQKAPGSSALGRRNVYSPNNAQGAKFNILNGRACTECKSIPDVFVNADVSVKALIEKTEDTVKSGPINVNVAVALLADVKILIKAIIADVNAIIKLNLDADALVTLNGKVLTVEACAKVIVDLVLDIVAAIKVIVDATVKVDLTAVLNVVAEVGVLIAALLKLTLGLVAHIDVDIAALLKASVQVFVDLKLQAVVDLIAAIKA